MLLKTRCIFIGLLTLAAAAAGAQDLCQMPMFVVQGTGEANVMILADNSFSMNEITRHPDYVHATTYSGRFDSDATYYVRRRDTYSPRDFDNTWEASPTCVLVASDNGVDGRYPGNYLNWLFYHATAAQRASAPQATRIQVLKMAMTDMLSVSSRLAFAITVYQNSATGGNILGQMGKNYNAIISNINGITANANWTPTTEAMTVIKTFFQGSLPSSPIQSPCIKNFLIVICDGLPDTPGMDLVAEYMATNDLRPDLPGDQHVYTYVIGYHVDDELLQRTATLGNGLYFVANNANQLRYSLEYAVQDVLRRISAGSAVAVVSTERADDDRLFRGKFMPVDWHGYLECYALPYTEGAQPLWEAGALLARRNPDTRDIFTALGTTVYGFTESYAGNLAAALGAASTAEARDLIRWGRGEPVDGLRSRYGWVLGDIVHSTPVVVGPPSEFHATPEYQAYAIANAEREKVVYVGANDGMLHAFSSADGEEIWAFVPELSLPWFGVMADSFYCHRYTVDQTSSVRDMQLNGVWRTVLVGGAREGGPGYFALDVTEPRNPQVLWQTQTPNLAPFPSQATIVKAGNRSMAIVGSGLDLTNGEAWVYAFDLATGDLLGSRRLSQRNNRRNKATQPAAVDRDLDGTAETLYMGDLLGSIWRIDLNNNANPNLWSIAQVFADNEPITAQPALAFDYDGNVRVYFGSGAYLQTTDMTTTTTNYFYGVIDRRTGSTISRSNLTNQTTSIQNLGTRPGWYVTLNQRAGERVTNQALVAAGNVIVTSFAPSHDSCIAGGESWLYRFNYRNGAAPEPSADGTEYDRVEYLGEGIASHPVLDLASGNVVVQGSDAALHIMPVGAPYSPMTVRFWQESFDFVTIPAQ